MTPFLLQIAEAYVHERRNSLIDYCFVFPNKRAATFFNDYVTRISGGNLILPRTTDIDSMVMEITHSIIPSRIEQLLILFNCYRVIVTESGGEPDILSLETFIPWGEMVLNDFNDADLYLADPKELFRNLKHFKEISANFITEEQASIIESYWGGELTDYWNDERLWNHLEYDDQNKATVRNFYRLWMLMYPLYLRFGNALKQRNRTYNGLAYRRLAESLDAADPFSKGTYAGNKFVFVGFNLLSLSLEKLFIHLRDKGIAHFYWDDTSPAFKESLNPSARQISRYKKMFPGDESLMYDFEAHIPEGFPEIEIIGVPSHYAEVKKGAQVLERLLSAHPEEFEGMRTRRTAFVVPEEILVLPLLDSIPEYKNPNLPDSQLKNPENLLKVNLTMAFPQKNSPFSSLFRLLTKLYEHSRFQSGDTVFYYKDVIALFSHPTLRTAHPDLCLNTVTAITREHIFEITRSWLTNNNKEIAALFPKPSNGFSTDDFDQIRAQLICLRDLTPTDSIESAFANSYLRGLDTLERHCLEHNIPIDRQTILNQLQKVASSDAVHFAGEPLEGIQVMGMLETRAIDFDNLIILGANERVFPRKQLLKSFIPMSLRREYNLPTSEKMENVYAYYFYRLIGRAKRVFLIYDARCGTGGEMSRYLYQLLYIYSRQPGVKVRHHTDYYALNSAEDTKIKVGKKTAWIKLALDALRTPGSGEFLSASYLKDYLECPLKFFLKKIAKFSINDDIKDYIEESGYGTIVHSVLENIYNLEKASGNFRFYPKDINILRETKKSVILRETVRSIRKILYGLGKDETNSLPPEQLTPESLRGEHALLSTIIAEVVDNVLSAEANFNDIEYFNYENGEYPITGNIQLTPSLNVNVKGYIDRIDRIKLPENDNTVLRFIDYKTGNEPVRVPSEEDLFDAESSNWPKGIFQLLFYCHVYSIINNTSEIIIPQIFNIRRIKKDSISFISYKPDGAARYEPVKDYHLFRSFRQRINDLVEEIFNPDIPFENRPSDSACKYCKFKAICNV